MDIYMFLVMGLSTWRLSSFLVNENGPWDIFVKVREVLGIQHDEDGDIISWSGVGNFFGPLLECLWCTSVWVGFVVYASYFAWTPVFHLHLVLALSTVAILVNERTNG